MHALSVQSRLRFGGEGFLRGQPCGASSLWRFTQLLGNFKQENAAAAAVPFPRATSCLHKRAVAFHFFIRCAFSNYFHNLSMRCVRRTRTAVRFRGIIGTLRECRPKEDSCCFQSMAVSSRPLTALCNLLRAEPVNKQPRHPTLSKLRSLVGINATRCHN